MKEIESSRTNQKHGERSAEGFAERLAISVLSRIIVTVMMIIIHRDI